MRANVLNAILAAREAKSALAVVTRIADGAQCTFDGTTVEGELDLSPAWVDEVRTQMRDDRSGTFEDGALFVHIHNPPLRLIIIGAVHIAQALAPMAAITGFDVTVVDPRGTFATEERFPGITLNDEWPDEALEALAPDARTAVVTLTHDPKLDDPALEVALRGPAFYIASLGGKKTHGGRLERLKAAGFDAETLARINGPAGLNIGGVSPAEIAVSILAELTAIRHGRPTMLTAA
ncbi:MAG: XdhC family protein [Alphaproteobacteria bacterium]|nr:XdhC family protein [Alphaproteobacteria bacterium]